MLELHDPQVRLLLLNHVAVRLVDAGPGDLSAVGIDDSLLGQLRRLSAFELSRLASMRSLSIVVGVDGKALEEGLRTVSHISEAKAMEAYFIRHGASTGLMSDLFKVHPKLTLKRRRSVGAQTRCGRLSLPDQATRLRIQRCWHHLNEPSLRSRYYQLHQAFSEWPIAALEAVIRQYEVDA